MTRLAYSAAASSRRLALVGEFLVGFGLCFVATLFPIVFGEMLWPGGLRAGAQTVLWPATGVALAGVLRLGWRFLPLAYGASVLALVAVGRPWGWALYSSLGNGLELFVAWRMVVPAVGAAVAFERVRAVLALVMASLLAALLSALVGVSGLVYRGVIPAAEGPSAVLVWTLANSGAMLCFTPFLAMWGRGVGRKPSVPWERSLWVAVAIPGMLFGFGTFLSEGPKNFAFLAFPFLAYAALRFGPVGAWGALVGMAGTLYGAFALVPEGEVSASPLFSIWFLQTFCWVLAATTLVVAALHHEREDAQSRALAASLGEERARLAALRYQVNPHFLFNTLNSLRATLPPEALDARGMVTNLAGYLRDTLESERGDFVSLEQEVDSLKRYLAIEEKRFGERLSARFELAPEALGCGVPVLLLQPLVENAIVHGLSRSREAFRLVVKGALEGEGLCLRVENTGAWRTEPSSSGHGLANIRWRLGLLYGDGASLTHEALEGWVVLTLRLPVGEPD